MKEVYINNQNRPRLISCNLVNDNRGRFCKILSRQIFNELPVNYIVKEVFYTHSKLNVIRGIHLQTAPMGVTKIVKCVEGQINDVVVNLNKTKGQFGEVLEFQLHSDDNKALVVPPDFGHGFLTKTSYAGLVYLYDMDYSPEHDRGVKCNSINYDWKIKNPIISERDALFPPIEQFC